MEEWTPPDNVPPTRLSICSIRHTKARVSDTPHGAHIIQHKQKGNKCWNKILLISPGAANRATAMEGAKSPFLFYCMNANPAGKRGGRQRGVGARGCGHAHGISAPLAPTAPALDPREVSPSTLPTRKKWGWAATALRRPRRSPLYTGSTDFVFNLLRLFR